MDPACPPGKGFVSPTTATRNPIPKATVSSPSRDLRRTLFSLQVQVRVASVPSGNRSAAADTTETSETVGERLVHTLLHDDAHSLDTFAQYAESSRTPRQVLTQACDRVQSGLQVRRMFQPSLMFEHMASTTREESTSVQDIQMEARDRNKEKEQLYDRWVDLSHLCSSSGHREVVDLMEVCGPALSRVVTCGQSRGLFSGSPCILLHSGLCKHSPV